MNSSLCPLEIPACDLIARLDSQPLYDQKPAHHSISAPGTEIFEAETAASQRPSWPTGRERPQLGSKEARQSRAKFVSLQKMPDSQTGWWWMQSDANPSLPANWKMQGDFDEMQGGDSLYVTPAPGNLAHRQLIADLAIESRLPSVNFYRENVEAGGLMGYGPDIVDTFRQAAGYLDLIFKGANPAEMPFQQPTKFELTLNLKTAKALELSIPPNLLALATAVIE
jgi:hypothetical protein